MSGGLSNSQVEFTALICAAWNGHEDCVKLLIDTCVDKEVKIDVRRQ